LPVELAVASLPAGHRFLEIDDHHDGGLHGGAEERFE